VQTTLENPSFHHFAQSLRTISGLHIGLDLTFAARPHKARQRVGVRLLTEQVILRRDVKVKGI